MSPRSLRTCVTLVALALSIGCASMPATDERQAVDILITGGTVLTMAGPPLGDSGVAIRDGVILEVAPSSDLARRYRATEMIDARGSAVMPGLVNAHTHAPMVLFRGIADDRDLMDWLQNFIFPAEAKNVDREFVKWGTRLALAEMILSGTTTYADMYYFEDEIARETRAAGVRGVLGETLIDFPAPDNKTWEEAIAYARRFVAEFKGDPLITPALAPHAIYTVSKEHLQEVDRLARELGVPVLIHLSETEDEIRQSREKYAMLPAEFLDSIGFLGDHVVAAHGVWLAPDEHAILARHRTGVVHNPESNMMLASGVAPVTALRAAGVAVGLGTDGPAGSNNNLDMIEEMASAARLQKVFRKDPKALSAGDVLRMATIEGAKALNLDSKIGSLEPGKRADVIVINLATPSTEPVYSVESAIVYAASGDNVTATIVDGKVLMRDRKLRTIDIDQTLAKAREYRAKIAASVGMN